jgi:hypothetical protein
MTRKSEKRARRTRPDARSRKGRVEREIRKILGAPSRASLDSRILNGAKRAQLLEICDLLGTRGTTRLKKGEIVQRIERALGIGDAAPAERKAAGRRKSGPERKGAERPTPAGPVSPRITEHGWSRAEFQARKFSLDEPIDSSSPSPDHSSLPKTIPWGYGRTRVGALPVDPDRLFVYWEITDDAIEQARRSLGPAGTDARLNLRVFDTTGRLFDGTNAHRFFDQSVGNDSRQWFFDIGRPGSEAFVEIGLRSSDGRFHKVARSGRVSFPRRAPVSYREPQWLTVRASTEEPVLETPAARMASASRSAEAPHQPSFRPSPEAGRAEAWHTLEPGTASTEILEQTFELSEWIPVERVWEGPVSTTAWESEPFSIPLDVPEPVSETYPGAVRTFQVDGRTHVVYGPWQVVVRGVGAYGGRRVVSRWVVYRSWAVEATGVPTTVVWKRMMGSSALVGGSERRLRAASELRLSGSSELLYRGASERRLGGASERVYAAASEKLMRGASERRFPGASERRLGGASERRLGGASERSPAWRIVIPDE